MDNQIIHASIKTTDARTDFCVTAVGRVHEYDYYSSTEPPSDSQSASTAVYWQHARQNSLLRSAPTALQIRTTILESQLNKIHKL